MGIIDAVVAHLPAYLAQNRLDRSGWFHCSDLNMLDGKKVEFCVRQYLGLPVEKDWDADSALKVGAGTLLDQIVGAALEASGSVMATQIDLKDEELRLRGTPDFMLDSYGEDMVGDVKSCGGREFDQFYANDDWDISRYYAWPQLQAYLMLTETEEGRILFVDREILCAKTIKGRYDRKDLQDYFCLRPYWRDEKQIRKIRDTLAYLCELVDSYQEASD